ncbi:MAG: acyl-CoA synthetase, partial [Pseudomonadota bacterium]
MTRDPAITGAAWQAPTASALVFRALRRFPDRPAFTWDGGSLTYAGALDTIARFQSVFSSLQLHEPLRLALLSANRADAWCAEVAAQALGGGITWLHPMGALADQVEQLAD